MKIVTAEELIRGNSFKQLPKLLEQLSDSGFIPLPQDWAAEHRYIPPEVTEWPGFFDITSGPQYAEILANQHPDCPVRKTTVVKPVQSGFTTIVLETISGWGIKYKLGNQLMIQSTKTMMEAKSDSGIDVMIDHSGLAGLLRPTSIRMKRKTGDKALYKSFQGGTNLLMTSWNADADHKSMAYSIIMGDEYEEAKQVTKGQGSRVQTIDGRGNSKSFFKFINGCTSSDMHTSNIWAEYIRGTQKQFFVPCPICGEPQILVPSKGEKYGLTFNVRIDSITKNRVLDESSVRYICKFCKGEFYDAHKKEICNKGFWEETWQKTEHTPEEDHESYQFNSLISQQLQGGWETYCREFIKTKFGKNIELYKTFTINYDGMPFAYVEKNYTWRQLKKRAESYTMGFPPENAGILMYGGADIQKNRIELSVVSFKPGFEMYYVDYRVFFGNTKDLNDNCWRDFDNFVVNARYDVRGIDVCIEQVAIDTNWDPDQKTKKSMWQTKSHTVMQFVAQHGGGGKDSAKESLYVAVYGGNERNAVGMVESKRVSGDAIQTRFEVATGRFKHIIMNSIEKSEGPYSIHVPRFARYEGGMEMDEPVSDEWYKMFMSERYQQLSSGKPGWYQFRDRNEVLDTIIYAMSCAYLNNLDSYDDDVWEEIENGLIQKYYN